jgi:hypothetical protein
MRASIKESYASMLLDLVEQYLSGGGKTPYSTRDIAEWAISHGHWDRKTTAVAVCARDISRALREDYYTDAKGRLVRARHSVRTANEREGGKKQKTLWNDHRRMDYEFAERSFKQRRMQIVGDCKQLKTDVDSYNDAHADQSPIQLVLNFTYDVLESESAAPLPPNKPR